MAKLRKASTPKPGADSATPKQSNSALTTGIALFAFVGLLMFIFTTNLQSKTTIFIAKQPIPPYTAITPDMLTEKQVPKDSVEAKQDLTPESFERQFANAGKRPVTRVEILPGQRIDQRVLTASSTGTLSVVKDSPDKSRSERVVAVNTTFSGIVGGAVIPGAVVDIYSSSGGGLAGEGEDGASSAIAEDIKVLGVGTGAGAAQSLRTDAATAEVRGKGAENNAGGDIVVLLAVPADEVAGVVGAGTVVLSLNPHLAFDVQGNICPILECAQARPAAEAEGDQPDADAATDGEPTVEGDATATDTTDTESELPADPVDEQPSPGTEGR